jgi:hypothetical protein
MVVKNSGRASNARATANVRTASAPAFVLEEIDMIDELVVAARGVFGLDSFGLYGESEASDGPSAV